MRKIMISSYNIIHGKCSLFACLCCRTKYGWEHQQWCELSMITQPTCRECRYYSERDGECTHPSKKQRKEDIPYEKNKRIFRV